MSHGVHRGVLKKGNLMKEKYFEKFRKKNKKIDYDFFGYNKENLCGPMIL